MINAIPVPKHWDEILKYSIYKNGFRVGIREDAPKEVKEAFHKMQEQYEREAQKGVIL